MTRSSDTPVADRPSIRVPVSRLPHAEDLPLPAYATAGSAGLDLSAAIDATMILEPGGRALVPTGLILHLPPGCEGQVRPRSGLALKNGVTCLNTPGTIDADYRGEVGVILINHGIDPFEIQRGMRIAQLVIAPVSHAVIVEAGTSATDLPTARGSGGFGSTGLQDLRRSPISSTE